MKNLNLKGKPEKVLKKEKKEISESELNGIYVCVKRYYFLIWIWKRIGEKSQFNLASS